MQANRRHLDPADKELRLRLRNKRNERLLFAQTLDSGVKDLQELLPPPTRLEQPRHRHQHRVPENLF